VLLLACVVDCGGGGQSASDGGAPGSVTKTEDASLPGAPTGGTCGARAAAADLCQALPSGTITACSVDGAGQPSQTGYLQIRAADGTQKYVCATSWSDGGMGGYWFGHPDQFMSDGQSCCGGSATPAAAPTAPQPAAGYLGAPHAATDIKPQEMSQLGAGPIRQNPFAIVVRDSAGGAAVAAAVATWLGWSGDGNAHPGPDGSGAYYFSKPILVNYTILEDAGGAPIVVIGPEVSLTSDGKSPLGHPTLGGCTAGGGAPLVLMAGELAGTNLTNHSGRFGHDASVTPDALANAAALFNCLGIQVTGTPPPPPQP
jgi:hypothetical protein